MIGQKHAFISCPCFSPQQTWTTTLKRPNLFIIFSLNQTPLKIQPTDQLLLIAYPENKKKLLGFISDFKGSALCTAHNKKL